MTFLDTIPLNSVWFGCETATGTTEWSMDILEILRCPYRKRFTPIYEARFCDIRDKFLEINNEIDREN